ncbi:MULTISPECIES: hypothetical protein [Geobacillus]|uniref:hypothetical protein n=1 Tax=Geobacillus TaxID=129337 RepID=UPI0005CCF961|nr:MULTISPECIES: hypothetical protein [Geobacillus]MDF9296089.1 hypothetical protein [Geobacillus stearothermophilus]
MNIEQWIEFTEKNIMTKQEAKEFLGMSEPAFVQSIRTRRLIPIFERGEGPAKVRLFYREDVEKYKQQVEERRKRLKK